MHPIRRPALAACLMLAMALGLPATSARADLVIEGRAAQALHCSALLYMVSSALYEAGYLARNDMIWAQAAANAILERHVPGTQGQKVTAMKSRFKRIIASRTPLQIMQEWDDTRNWCARNFLR